VKQLFDQSFSRFRFAKPDRQRKQIVYHHQNVECNSSDRLANKASIQLLFQFVTLKAIPVVTISDDIGFGCRINSDFFFILNSNLCVSSDEKTISLSTVHMLFTIVGSHVKLVIHMPQVSQELANISIF
jgi:hypothetical protein